MSMFQGWGVYLIFKPLNLLKQEKVNSPKQIKMRAIFILFSLLSFFNTGNSQDCSLLFSSFIEDPNTGEFIAKIAKGAKVEVLEKRGKNTLIRSGVIEGLVQTSQIDCYSRSIMFKENGFEDVEVNLSILNRGANKVSMGGTMIALGTVVGIGSIALAQDGNSSEIAIGGGIAGLLLTILGGVQIGSGGKGLMGAFRKMEDKNSSIDNLEVNNLENQITQIYNNYDSIRNHIQFLNEQSLKDRERIVLLEKESTDLKLELIQKTNINSSKESIQNVVNETKSVERIYTTQPKTLLIQFFMSKYKDKKFPELSSLGKLVLVPHTNGNTIYQLLVEDPSLLDVIKSKGFEDAFIVY